MVVSPQINATIHTLGSMLPVLVSVIALKGEQSKLPSPKGMRPSVESADLVRLEKVRAWLSW